MERNQPQEELGKETEEPTAAKALHREGVWGAEGTEGRPALQERWGECTQSQLSRWPVLCR